MEGDNHNNPLLVYKCTSPTPQTGHKLDEGYLEPVREAIMKKEDVNILFTITC